MKSKILRIDAIIAVIIGIAFAVGIDFALSPAQATTTWTHFQNVDPNPLLKGTKDVWWGRIDTTSLSVNVGESWKGNAWNTFEIWFETASDTLKHSELGYTYTNLHYDSRSTPDTLQSTLTGADPLGGICIIEATDWDGI